MGSCERARDLLPQLLGDRDPPLLLHQHGPPSRPGPSHSAGVPHAGGNHQAALKVLFWIRLNTHMGKAHPL